MTRKTLRDFMFLLMSMGSAAVVSAQNYPTIPYKDAAGYVDVIVWIEGTVLKTESTPEGVYLLFSANEKFVRVLIPKANVDAFGGIQHKYTGKKIKAVGKVAKYGYKLIVGVNEPKRIKVVDAGT
ncbi:MAG TPA: hypothetical protein VJH87_12030 [Vicinamibacteria bacterium]|nr:hypothetical protein [Vicinamibacteria bacterium]